MKHTSIIKSGSADEPQLLFSLDTPTSGGPRSLSCRQRGDATFGAASFYTLCGLCGPSSR